MSRICNLFPLAGPAVLAATSMKLSSALAAPLPGGSLDPTSIPKYVKEDNV